MSFTTGDTYSKSLLRFSQTCKLWSSKAAFAIAFFAAVNHNYDHKQRTLKHRNTQNGSKSTHIFSKRPVKMIDGSEKRNRQLAFEIQNSHVCEKRSNKIWYLSVLLLRLPQNAHLITLSKEKSGKILFKALKTGFVENKGQSGPLSVVSKTQGFRIKIFVLIIWTCSLMI